ncbi:MAG: hypothetical protein LBM87_07025 [Ruminococcus sp.]|nr:hypothetical protein [Ruminococcus sp.]
MNYFYKKRDHKRCVTQSDNTEVRGQMSDYVGDVVHIVPQTDESKVNRETHYANKTKTEGFGLDSR